MPYPNVILRHGTAIARAVISLKRAPTPLAKATPCCDPKRPTIVQPDRPRGTFTSRLPRTHGRWMPAIIIFEDRNVVAGS
jgi:hypothetical protein